MKTLKNFVLERLKLNKDTKVIDTNIYLVVNIKNRECETYASKQDLIDTVVKNWTSYITFYELHGEKRKSNVNFYKFDSIENRDKCIELYNNKDTWNLLDIIDHHAKQETIDETGKSTNIKYIVIN